MQWEQVREIDYFERNELPEEPYPIVVEIKQQHGPPILR